MSWSVLVYRGIFSFQLLCWSARKHRKNIGRMMYPFRFNQTSVRWHETHYTIRITVSKTPSGSRLLKNLKTRLTGMTMSSQWKEINVSSCGFFGLFLELLALVALLHREIMLTIWSRTKSYFLLPKWAPSCDKWSKQKHTDKNPFDSLAMRILFLLLNK